MKAAIHVLLVRVVAIVLLSGSLGFAQVPTSTWPVPQDSNNRQVQANYERLPLAFEANKGQTDRNVRFVARGSGYTVFLTSGQMALGLRPSARTSNGATNASRTAASTRSLNAATNFDLPATDRTAGSKVIFMNLVGANRNPEVIGEDLQPGKVNYFIGNNPEKWRTNIPIYRRVHYKNIYPGIDLIYYGNQSRVEHDFVIAPGADPRQIQLDIEGADQVSVAENGDLVLRKGNDEVRFQSPVVYQEFHGMRIPVSGQFSIKSATRVSFTLGRYNKAMSLVIDPVLVYATYLGGSNNDEAFGITIDSVGSTYITGFTDSTDFPVASQNGPPPSGANVFVVKLDPTGASLVYADYIGGSGDACAWALAIDSANNVYITGNTGSSDFPLVNPYQATTPPSVSTAFVTEVSADGASLIYSTYLGGSQGAQANSIGLDRMDNIYVAGWTYSTDFPTVNAFEPIVYPDQGNVYGSYGFVTGFAAGGASLLYSTYYAGNTTVAVQGCPSCWDSSPYTIVRQIAVDPNGDAYVTGLTNTLNFPTTTGVYQPTNSTPTNLPVGFVGKFNSSGTLLYSTYFGATPANYEGVGAVSIAIDSSGFAYIAGTAPVGNGPPIPVTTPNLCDPSQTACDIGFITKFDPAAASIVYSTYLSPSIDAQPMSVVVDANGDAYVLSQSQGGPADSLVNPLETYTNGYDLFIQEIDPSGGTLLFSTFVGGSGDDLPGEMAVDPAGNIYVAGYTDSSDFPVTPGAVQNTNGGEYDVVVMKIGVDTAPSVSIVPSSIQFPLVPIGNSSQPSASVLRNMGSAPLTISSITASGDFSETDTCGSGVPSASNCTITVNFTPTQAGLRVGAVTIEDDAAGSPHIINLAGDGAAPVADLTPASLTFASVQVGQTSPAQTVTLTNNGNADLVIGQISIAAAYAEPDNCTGSLGIGASCQIQVTFTPTESGEQDGILSITDNAADSPQSVLLTGIGTSFSMPAFGGSKTIAPGATATYKFSITPAGGTYSTSINLACAGLPKFSTCSVNPSTVTLGGSPTSVTVAIKTAGNNAELLVPRSTGHSLLAVWNLTLGVGVFGMYLFRVRPRNGRTSRSLLLCGLAAGIMFWTSCAGVANSPSHTASSTPPGTYTIQVTGTSGAVLHYTTLSLTVQ